MPLHLELNFPLETQELHAVAALVHSLGGRVSGPIMSDIDADRGAFVSDRPKDPNTYSLVGPMPGDRDEVPASVVPRPPVAAPVETGGNASKEATPPAPAGVTVDSEGLPWDIRIHASTRTQKADKTWTLARKVDPALVAHVKAELRQAMAAAPAAVVPPVPSVPAVPEGDGPVATDPAAAFGGAPLAPATDAPPPSGEPVEPTALDEFARVMRVVSAKQAAGTLTTELANLTAQRLGLSRVGDLLHRPDLIPAFEASLP